MLNTRFALHGVAIDHILASPDGSIGVLTRAQFAALVADLRRHVFGTLWHILGCGIGWPQARVAT